MIEASKKYLDMIFYIVQMSLHVESPGSMNMGYKEYSIDMNYILSNSYIDYKLF